MSLFYGSGEMWCITNFQGHGSLVIHTNSREAEKKCRVGDREGREKAGLWFSASKCTWVL